MAGSPECDVFNVSVTDSKVPGSLVIGKDNTVNIYNLNIIRRRLHLLMGGQDIVDRLERWQSQMAAVGIGAQKSNSKAKFDFPNES